MIAESWDLDTSLSAGLIDGVGCVNWDSLAVNIDIELLSKTLGSSEESLSWGFEHTEGGSSLLNVS